MTDRATRMARTFAVGALVAGAMAWSGHAQQGRPLDFEQMHIRTTRLADNLYVAEASPGVGNVVFLTGPASGTEVAHDGFPDHFDIRTRQLVILDGKQRLIDQLKMPCRGIANPGNGRTRLGHHRGFAQKTGSDPYR